jgi:cytochrome c5
MKAPVTNLALLLLTAGALQADSFEQSFEQTVRPVLERRCVMCHGEAVAQANVRLDNLTIDLVENRRAGETWHDVLNALNRGEMPPKGAPALTADERTAVVDWLTAELSKAAKARRANGGQVVMRRLNRLEYQSTMRDLLGLDVDYVRNLPPDEMSRDGFANNGAALRISALQLEYYLRAARSGLVRAIVEGPAPPVFTHKSQQAVIDKVNDIHWSNRLGRTGIFVARMPEFPDEGEFEVRIRARAVLPAPDSPYPRMRVQLGYRADTETPRREVAVVDVRSEEGETFDFRGRIDEFPVQSRTQSKYPGMLVWADNVYSDGTPAPEGRKITEEVDGKRVVRWEWDEDLEFPAIVVESFEFRAPIYKSWPPPHHRELIPETPGSAAAEPAAARKALRGFLGRAYRRPVEEADIATSMRFFERIRPTVPSFEQAMREVYAMALVSPDFLYRVEDRAAGDDQIDDHELASRLSYFLWSTMPDERLRELADEGRLRDPATLASETERLLDDPRSWAFIRQFSDQWLDLSGVDRVAVNPNYYPTFDESLKAEMRRETQHFFGEVLRQGLSALSFLRADFAMLNQPLAAHYGVKGPRGGEFERVELAPSDRPGGLLGQGSILLANSTGEDSHPIERGVWIRRALLNDPPAPPPPAVPNLDSSEDAALLPLKRQLELHRDNAACAHCHQGIDPWGIALEEMDAVGLIRETILRQAGDREERHPVDAATVLPDGKPVNGVRELTDYLHANKDREFARALTAKLLTYALGRSLEFTDDETVDELTARFVADGYRLRGLAIMIATSDPFRGR